MAALTLRSAVGRPLTNSEVDANFSALNLELGQKLVASLNLLDLTNPAQARSNLGLGNVENKSSATIRGELTSGNVTTALGFTPANAASLSNYLQLIGGVISAGGSYPLSLNSSQRYMLQIRNTNNTVNPQYGWWLGTDPNFNFFLHADGATDRLTLTRDGALSVGGTITAGGSIFTNSAIYVNGYTVLNASNYGSYALPLSGGSAMTGPITWGAVGDNVNGSSWYGLGRVNSDIYGSGAAQMQVAGYYGLRLRTASAILDIYMGGASFNSDFGIGGGLTVGGIASFSADLNISGGLTAGGLGRSALNGIGGNIGATVLSWNNAQLEVKNTDAGTVGIALHRAGYTSNTISVTDTNGIRIDGHIALHAANFSNYAVNKAGDTMTGSHIYDGGLMINASSGTGLSRRTFAVARGENWSAGASYVHILLPSRYNSLNNRMFQLLVQGYALDVSGNRNINLMVSGYVTTLSNGGPINAISVWDATGQYSPTAYYSSNYARGVVRFYLPSKYYSTFVVDALQAGNGDVIAPGECSIVWSESATI